MKEISGLIIEKIVPEEGVRWTFGEIKVEDEKGKRHVFALLGVVIQWLRIGDRVKARMIDDASKKELVAIWRCKDGRIIEANVQPSCNGERAELVAIKGSLPASRFLVLELKDREAYEPAIIGYVRVDPPVPLMRRRIEKDGKKCLLINILD